MSKVILMLAAAILLMLPPIATAGTAPTRSDVYPVNHFIHDQEPGTDEQWDLDAAQGTNGRLYAVWTDMRLDYTDIRFSNSTDGSIWGDGLLNDNDIIVNDDSGLGAEHYHPSITVSDQMVLYAVWIVDDAGTTSLAMSKSVSQGHTWNRSWAIETNGSVSEPYLRWSENILMLTYVLDRPASGGGSQKEIMFARSDDGGITFSKHRVLNDDILEADQVNPRMSVEGDRVAVAWEDYRDGDYSSGSNPDIYFCHSTDGGLTFSSNIKVGDDPTEDSQVNPDVAYSPGGDLIIAFQDSMAEGWRISYAMAWTSSSSWHEDVISSSRAVSTSNMTRMDQSMPRLAYVDGMFALAWTEMDTRQFILIRAGYILRNGEHIRSDHIVDDAITLGERPKNPGIYYAQMDRVTSAVTGHGSKAQVFWIDYRTDPNPDNDIREDGDPYTAIAFPLKGAPEPPEAPVLRSTSVAWNSVRLEWNVSGDVDFKGYYLTYGKGIAPVPDFNQYNASIMERARNSHTFTGLAPDTIYQFRLMVGDQDNLKSFSSALNVRTGYNVPPRFEFLEPDGINDECDTSYTIRYQALDQEDLAYFELFYDTDQDPDDQVFLVSGFTGGDGIGEFEWNTTGLPPGGYTINATITDSINPPQTFYSYSIIISHPKVEIDHPRIANVNIEGGKDSAFADGSVTVTFSDQVSPVSVNTGSLFVLDGENQKVKGSLSIGSATTASWMPLSFLSFGVAYMLTVTSSVTDLKGNGLDGLEIGSPSTYRLQFHIRSADGDPQVRSYEPQGSGIRLRPHIQVAFDIPMDDSSLSPDNISLTDNAGSKVPLDIVYLSGTLTLSIEAKWPLTNFTEYRVRLSSAVRSDRSRGLPSPFEWTFTTGGPDMLTDSDSDGVPDDLDWFPNTRSESKDHDRDGFGDNADPDDDNDLIPDAWEMRYSLDPFDPADASSDPDGDGKTNLEEYRDGTDPLKGEENGSDPTLFILLFIVIASISAGLIVFGIVKYRNRNRDREMRSFYDEE